MTTGDFWNYGFGPMDDLLARFFGYGQQPFSRRVDIGKLLSEDAIDLLRKATQQAAEWGADYVDTEHMLWAAAQVDSARQALEQAGGDPDALAAQVEQSVERREPRQGPMALAPAAKRALLDARQVAQATGASYIDPPHLVLAMAANPQSMAGRLLREAHITPQSFVPQEGEPLPSQQAPPSSTPTLDQFGRDLTAAAREGGIDPVVGRDQEILRAIEVLSRRTKNNPALIGEPGVGKTAVVEGLAQRIADGEVPESLKRKRVVQLDLPGLVAGTKFRGEFEERLTKLMEEIRAHTGELIVFIDELHTVVGAGGAEGAIDASNMLKPALARGELHVIGATTLDEYRRYVEKDAALERRFQPILVPEPSVEDTIEILRGLRDRYEAHHQVKFTDEALVAAADLSDRYVSGRYLPDKAIDLMDEAGARVALATGAPTTGTRELEEELDHRQREKEQAVAREDYERARELRDEIAGLQARIEEAREGRRGIAEVTVEDIASVVSRATGIPVAQLTEEERDRLLGLEEHLHQRVIGQNEAVSAVAEAVRRSRAGLSDPARPIGSFLFLGPTGVGKTELARALAEALFGEQDRMIRLDMSEFQERHTVSRLVGAPPGYVGYEEAGQLTEQVRRKPYSVILLDEIEKAHPDVFNLLLQVLEDGRLTDGQGRTVDFRNTVLIMTSNLGADVIMAHRDDEQGLRSQLSRLLQMRFRPEFLNRVDETIVFRGLDAEQLRQITVLLLEETRRRLHAQGVTMEIEPDAVDWLAREGYQPHFGARPLRRTIQRKLDNTLSRLLLDGTLKAEQRAHIGVKNGDLAITVLDPDADLAGTEPQALVSPEPRANEERRKAEDTGLYL
ncbi:ATP-dependent Clp protease ATP-binding subunit [Nonomuraea sp. NPDC049649]|uniref:ATP-dependent Clp protease ATP-binding subunit n=1 Tax=Nonomuraea sp. NPDC049649 TaxID=3155776 RepID=UPI0034240A0E